MPGLPAVLTLWFLMSLSAAWAQIVVQRLDGWDAGGWAEITRGSLYQDGRFDPIDDGGSFAGSEGDGFSFVGSYYIESRWNAIDDFRVAFPWLRFTPNPVLQPGDYGLYRVEITGGGGGNKYPEIAVFGKGVEIRDGDTTPSAADDTEFPAGLTGMEAFVHTFTIHNTGQATLRLSGNPRVAVSGSDPSDFQVTSQPPSSLEPGASATLTVTFSPTASGTRSARIIIANNDPNENPYDFTIQGVGIHPPAAVPEISITGNGVEIANNDLTPSAENDTDFGSPFTGETVIHKFLIRNTGTAPLTLHSDPRVEIRGLQAFDFRVTKQPDPVIAPRGNSEMIITFTPGADGTRTADFFITNNDSDENPATARLRGNGVDRPAPPVAVTLPAADITSRTARLRGTVLSRGAPASASFLHREEGDWLRTALPGSVRGSAPLPVELSLVNLRPDTRYTFRAVASGELGRSEGEILEFVTGSAQPGQLLPIPAVTETAEVLRISLTPRGEAIVDTFADGVKRYGTDGVLDTTFSIPGWNAPVNIMAPPVILPDGKILFPGVNRFLPDGTRDSAYMPSAPNGRVHCALLQTDGKVIVGGLFTKIGFASKSTVARIRATGGLDTTFKLSVSGIVYCLAEDHYGRVLVGGSFTVPGHPHVNLVRCDRDGNIEPAFRPITDRDSYVTAMAAQADGKILVGHRRLERFHEDGAADTSFRSQWDRRPELILLSTDRSAVVCGVGGGMARILHTGEKDTLFTPAFAGHVRAAAIRADGLLIVGGYFSGGTGGSTLQWLDNQDTRPSLTLDKYRDGNVERGTVTWVRDGDSPETAGVTFDVSTDEGLSWTPLGDGSRITGLGGAPARTKGWTRHVTGLPERGLLRGRARVSDGVSNGSLMESVISFGAPPSFTEWLGSHGLAGADPAGDVDRDGVSNLLEFALGLDPKSNQDTPLPEWAREGDSLLLEFPARANAGPHAFQAEYAERLSGPWTAVADTGPSAWHRFQVPLGGRTRVFARLRITAP